MRRNLLYFALAFAFVAVLYAIVYTQRTVEIEPLPEDGRVTDVRALDSLYESWIRALGPLEAYKRAATVFETYPHIRQHEHAHLFGGALYRTEGLSGFAACDSRFAFGCYHEFIGLAIEDKGPAVISELNDECITLGGGNLACQHGIGHGVVGYTGYEESDLDAAVLLCKSLRKSDPIGGCYGGMYMEYNLFTMKKEGIRSFSPERPFAPCDKVDDVELRRACLYWQIQWWDQVLGSDPGSDEHFRKIGAYCRTAQKRFGVYQECFQGIGNVVASASGFDIPRARELCSIASRTEEELAWCINVGANHFGSHFSGQEGVKMCSALSSQSLKTACEKWAENRFNIVTSE